MDIRIGAGADSDRDGGGSARSGAASLLQPGEQVAQSPLVLRLGQLPAALIDQPPALRALQERADALGECCHRGASSGREPATYPSAERRNPGRSAAGGSAPRLALPSLSGPGAEART